MDLLQRIAGRKREELKILAPHARRLERASAQAPPVRPFGDALLRATGVAVIAEFKRRSPSAGWIREAAAAGPTAAAYERGGAAALSILTDSDFFAGGLEDLEQARQAVRIPVLRKDFILDELQVLEARAAGADAVLLIVRLLEDAQLARLMRAARELGMDALVEAHDAAEIRRALDCGARVLGINTRDLSTFRTDFERFEALASDVPDGVVLVAESAIRGREDVARAAAAGADAVLVGETLMRAADAADAVRALAGVHRGRRGTPAEGARA